MMLVLIDHDNNTNICFEMNSQLTEPFYNCTRYFNIDVPFLNYNNPLTAE